MGNQTSTSKSPSSPGRDSAMRRSNYFRRSNFRSGAMKKKKPATSPGSPPRTGGSFRSPLKSVTTSNPASPATGSHTNSLGPAANRFHKDVGRMSPSKLDLWKLEKPVDRGGQLIVECIELHCHLNKGFHSTEEYQSTDLIIRRGQSFQITMRLDRQFNDKNDTITIRMTTGTIHKICDSTLVQIPILKEIKKSQWSAVIKNIDNCSVTLDIWCPVKSLIGRYRLMVETRATQKDLPEREFIYQHDDAVYILFNPWCEGNFQPCTDVERKEYVQSDTGFIWFGTSKHLSKRAWDFAQFDEIVLRTIMFIIESSVNVSARNDPIKVSQIVCNVLNGHHEYGVMECRWDNKYSFGVPPATWNSSRRILEEYMKTQRPVRYGQCWTLAGLLTTMCRCIGIPARCVTSFNCNHDAEKNTSVNIYFDSNSNQPIENMNDQSLWFFHVWNEVWMTRTDLPQGYDGWQVLDPTPQETSKGLSCIGPVPLNAVKQGHLYYPYDSDQLFTSVNSTVTFWSCSEEFGVYGQMRVVKQHEIDGQMIYTKALGKAEPEDITHLYRHPTGSKEHKMTIQTVCELGLGVETEEDVQTQDVEIKIETPDDAVVGSDFNITITMHNSSAEERNIEARLKVQACFYTGVTKERCKEELLSVKLKPKETSSSVVHMAASDYMMKLADHSCLRVFLFGRVEETNSKLVCHSDMCLARPELEITLKNTDGLKADEIFFAVFQFMNPVSIALTNCRLTVDGCGVEAVKPVEMPDIEPFQNLKTKMKLRLIKGGHQTLIAGFTCDQINNVTGYIELDIERLV
ncbi:coagulation factor XIII A chain-like [Anneissia japonica]|uniref:coagulation factor XIII A chain-like n=1 Tax=Anneissia japonica TaxID=1529436 RepID=UPI001425ABAA|nr:coagulation factor XIII A chain-like [Anneissia japonica]